MKQAKNYIIVLVVGILVGCSSMYKYMAGQQKEVETKTVTLTEKVVVTEAGKTTTIYRVKNEKQKKETPKPPKQWRTTVLIEPQSPSNYTLGVGYRVFPNVFVEGSWMPNNGQILLGVGIEF